MKTKLQKILGIGLTLTLVLSLGLVFAAAPVAADDDEWSAYAIPEAGLDGDWFMDEGIEGLGPIARDIDGNLWAASGMGTLGTNEGTSTAAVWSTTVDTASQSGAYNAFLTRGHSYVEFVPQGGITLADFDTVMLAGTDTLYTFQNWVDNVAANHAQIEFKFTDPTDYTDFVDINFMQHSVTGTDAWATRAVDGDEASFQFWGPHIGSSGVNVDWDALILLAIGGAATIDSTDYDAYELTRVRIELYENLPARTAYIDDVTINGVLYNMEPTELYKSTDDGHSWEATNYSDATDGVLGDAIVDIACSTVDADVVYVADNEHVYKTEDGGDSWGEAGDYEGANAANEGILCLGVGWDEDDDPRVFVGTDAGNVWYLYDVAFGADFTDLTLNAPATPLNVWGFGISPDFANDAFQAVLVSDATQTFLAYHIGSNPGGWDSVELDDADGADFLASGGSNPVFPSDFNGDDFYDEDTEIFVGAAGADILSAATDLIGGVWRVYGTTAGDEEVLDNGDFDVNISNLAIVGTLDNTQLLAGEAGDNDVWYSWDAGSNWEQASAEGINPAGGAFDTYVLMGADFDEDTGIGWAATSGAECGVSMTIDGGASWQGISLLHTDIDQILAAVVTTSPEVVYILTEDVGNTAELFRYDSGTEVWTRLYEEAQYNIGAPTLLAVIDDTIVMAEGQSTGLDVIFSSDLGQTFGQPDEEPTSTIVSLLLLDEETWWIGDTDGDLWVTDDAGDRAWDEYEIEGTDDITSLAVRGDEGIAGVANGEIYYSEDAGETWDIVGAAIDTLATYVCFADDNTDVIYAASDETVARFQYLTIDLTEDWEVFDDGDTIVFDAATSIACLDGVVYASDGTVDGGVMRVVEPLDNLLDVTDSEVDELVNAGLGAADILDGGIFVTSSSPNTVWGVETAAAGSVLWTYTDLMVGPLTGIVAIPGDTDATLTWDGFDNATNYEVAVYSDEDMRVAYRLYDANTGDDEPMLILNATTAAPDAGTTYWVQARGSAPVHSKWSAVYTFSTDPGAVGIDEDSLAPSLGAMNVPIDTPFSWGFDEDADSYLIEISDTADFSNIIDSATVTVPAYQSAVTLNEGTNYWFRVYAIAGGQMGNPAYSSFTTAIAGGVAPTPPAATPSTPVEVIQQTITPNYIYAIIGIGAALAILVIVLITKTKRS